MKKLKISACNVIKHSFIFWVNLKSEKQLKINYNYQFYKMKFAMKEFIKIKQ